MFVLSKYTGKGTRSNPFRPVIEGASIDLRPDSTRVDGYAIVATDSANKGRKIADFKSDTMKNKKRFDVELARMLRPFLVPSSRGCYEIWLDELMYREPVIAGGSTDNFNRGDEIPIHAPWTKVTGNNASLISNGFEKSGGSGDTVYYYSGAAVTANQYCEAVEASGTSDWGPAVRVAGSSANQTAYIYDPYAFGAPGGIFKYVNASFTMIWGAAAYTLGETIRIEVDGNSISFLRNGTPDVASPRTDTEISAAGFGVGLWIYNTGQRVDNWAGGDLVPPTNIGTIAGLANASVGSVDGLTKASVGTWVGLS